MNYGYGAFTAVSDIGQQTVKINRISIFGGGSRLEEREREVRN